MSSRCFQPGENYFFKKYLPSKNKGALFGLRQQRSMLARLSLSALRREGLKCLAVFKCAFLRASFLSWCAQADCCSVGVDTELWLKMLSPD